MKASEAVVRGQGLLHVFSVYGCCQRCLSVLVAPVGIVSDHHHDAISDADAEAVAVMLMLPLVVVLLHGSRGGHHHVRCNFDCDVACAVSFCDCGRAPSSGESWFTLVLLGGEREKMR